MSVCNHEKARQEYKQICGSSMVSSSKASAGQCLSSEIALLTDSPCVQKELDFRVQIQVTSSLTFFIEHSFLKGINFSNIQGYTSIMKAFFCWRLREFVGVCAPSHQNRLMALCVPCDMSLLSIIVQKTHFLRWRWSVEECYGLPTWVSTYFICVLINPLMTIVVEWVFMWKIFILRAVKGLWQRESKV